MKLPRYQLGAKVATRLAYGQSLAALGTRSNVVALEVGADGPSQMALEDLAMMRAMHGPMVLYPSDATSTAYLVQQMAERSGIVYMRTTRGPYPVLYSPDEEFPIGGAKVVRSSPDDQVTLVGAGVTLHSCLDAADQLSREGTHARVIDLYSVKPIDTATLVAAASATEARMVVVEDHYPQGGLGARCSRPSTTQVTLCASSTLPSAACPGRGRPGAYGGGRDLLWSCGPGRP